MNETNGKRRYRYPHRGPVGLGQRVFTTGQVARLCCVAPRTVTKWCDSGRLRHYRVPLSLDRRISRADLVTFLREWSLQEALERLGASTSVLTWGLPEAFAAELSELAGCEVLTAACPAEGGSLWDQHRPPGVVLDLNAGREAGLTLAGWLLDQSPRPLTVLLWPEDVVPRPILGARGLRHPVRADEVAMLLREVARE